MLESVFHQRIDPHVTVRRISPFQSQRSTPIKLIVIHATESSEEKGSLDLAAIGSWFCDPQAQVSAHVCTDATAGTSARYVDDAAKAWHCFAGDEEFLTAEGPRSFGESVGTTQAVLTSEGLAMAEIESFGIQQTQRVTFAPAHKRNHWRTGAEYWSASVSLGKRDVVVTPDHEWILADGETTRDLRVGDVIEGCVRIPNADSDEYATGIRDGFVFADGYRQDTTQTDMRFAAPMHGDKDWVAPYFDRVAVWPSRQEREHTYKATGLCSSARDLKMAPTEVDDPDYLAGWVRGWLAGDGWNDGTSYVVTSADVTALEFLLKIAPLAGYTVVGSEAPHDVVTTYGPTRTGRVRLRVGAVPWRVQSIEPVGEQDVFCAVVPGTHDFTLAGGLLTHNCAGYNSYALGIEQIGHTAQKSWARDEIRETARWVARWSLMHGIPIQRGEVSNGNVIRPGVVRHMDLGAIGGGHYDPGSNYPFEAMLHLADFYRGKLIARHHA